MTELAELEADPVPSKELVLLIASLPKFSYLPPALFKDQLYNIIYTAIVKWFGISDFSPEHEIIRNGRTRHEDLGVALWKGPGVIKKCWPTAKTH